MHIAICIVGFRNAKEVATCVGALAQCSYPSFDIVICENGGPEAHDALSAILPDRLPGGQCVSVLLAPGNLGYAGGVNACIRASEGADAWWVVNPDTRPEPTALLALIERLSRGDCEAVGGILYHPDGHIQAYGGRWRSWFARAESIGHGRLLSDPIDVRAVEAEANYLLGASMLIGARFVREVGLMREDYFLYCEEVEWCLRGGQRGMRFGFASGARVLHGQGGTTGSADAMGSRPKLPIYLDERNKLNVVRDTTPLRLPVAVLCGFMLLFLRFARRGAWRQMGYGLAGWAAGVRGRRKIPPWMR